MIGKVLGHYRIEAVLGAGGMGEVYLAHDLHLERKVALKVLRSDVTSDAERQRRFVTEARSASALNDPNIVAIYDIAIADDRLFIAMEHVPGTPLNRLLSTRRLTIDEALDFGIQIAGALAATHRAGIIHRDIKPANIIVSDAGHVKVVDFGLAKLLSSGHDEAPTVSADVTARGAVVGTLAYMPPEQAAAKAVDARADVFSLGVVLHEMMTGDRPIGTTASHATDIPGGIRRVLQRCLDPNPEGRYRSAQELRNDLIECRGHREARRVSMGAVIRRPAIALPALAFVLLAITVGGWFWRNWSRDQDARQRALPQIAKYLADGKRFEAYRLIRRTESILGNDPFLNQLRREALAPLTIVTEPAGAEVSVRGYVDEGPWELLGLTPINDTALPLHTEMRVRIVKSGFEPAERPFFGGGLQAQPTMSVTLEPVASSAGAMVRVTRRRVEWLERDVEDFWIDRYEVTNRDFKRFVDARGYANPSFWPEPLNQRSLFRDTTGRPGPATWEYGTHQEDRGDFPVNGVSWYEAAAYCAWAGKQLPTIYHWSAAASFGGMTQIARFANLGGQGPKSVGGHLGALGIYDMAGNVKEWTQTADQNGRRYILGGGWNEPSYMFRDPDTRTPHDRAQTHGLRCARYPSPLSPDLVSPVERPERDYRAERPVDNAAFDVYRRLYAYDAAPLHARVEEIDDRSSYWRLERVTIDAAYGGERLPVLLFLPKHVSPPYQAVIWFPGANAFLEGTAFVAYEWQMYWLSFIVRSGRAVVFPMYKGTYNRGGGRPLALPHVWYDAAIFGRKDLGRTLDYLATRQDIDAGRVAYYGISSGAGLGPIMTALEPRFKASALLGGGLYPWRRPPEVDPLNFLPRVTVPTLMLNGRHDFFFPVNGSQAPMFQLFGTRTIDKRHRIFESGHMPSERQELIREILAWLDRYLGEVKSSL